LTPEPFATLAREADMSESEALTLIRRWVEDGVIRRFGARLRHHSVGYVANGMSVWKVPEDRVATAADYMKIQPEISHCYLRRTCPEWNYNLYAMIHGKTPEAVRETAHRIAQETGLTDYDILFSQKEFKKTAPKFF